LGRICQGKEAATEVVILLWAGNEEKPSCAYSNCSRKMEQQFPEKNRMQLHLKTRANIVSIAICDLKAAQENKFFENTCSNECRACHHALVKIKGVSHLKFSFSF
jgi:hypothetical protein